MKIGWSSNAHPFIRWGHTLDWEEEWHLYFFGPVVVKRRIRHS